MRKLLLVSGLLLSGALLTGSPASAETGCECVKLGAAPVCVSSIAQCNRVIGGLCIAPCDYKAPKMVKRHYKPKKMAKRRPPPKSMKKPAPKMMKKPAKKKAM